MKNNNKGFMLAELVIVSTVVIGTMVALYTGFNRAYINYKERSKYYSIDCLYAGQTIKNLLIDEYRLTPLLNNLTTYQDINAYCTSVGTNSAFNQFCQEVYSRYNIDKMYILKYTKNNLQGLKSENATDVALTKYIDILLKSATDESSDYHIIIKDNNAYFANLKVVQ